MRIWSKNRKRDLLLSSLWSLTSVLQVCIRGGIALRIVLVSVTILVPVTDEALGVEGVFVHCCGLRKY